MNTQLRGAIIDLRESHRTGGRFASLLSTDACVRPLYDNILFEVDGCVVTPTLGSILPYWLLVIPRLSTTNFVQWRLQTGIEPHEIVERVLSRRNVSADRAIWFEHGAIHSRSPISCGVDHAHLHIIVDAPFSFAKFSAKSKYVSKLFWHEQSVHLAYPTIQPGTSYLFGASEESSICAEGVDAAGSQFFRRVIADLVHQPEQWNYKTHAHLDNVRKTVRAFA